MRQKNGTVSVIKTGRDENCEAIGNFNSWTSLIIVNSKCLTNKTKSSSINFFNYAIVYSISLNISAQIIKIYLRHPFIR